MTQEEMIQAIKDLQNIVARQRVEIKQLNVRLGKLKEWSDLNDQYLEEMINSLTHCVDNLMGMVDDERDFDFIYDRALEDILVVM
jgi:hypothetical protein